MKKKSLAILCVLLIAISLTACKGKIDRVGNDKAKDDAQEETINGHTKEEIEDVALPDVEFDENDAKDSSQRNEQSNGENTTDESEVIEEIFENYQQELENIVFPDDEF